MLKCKNRSRRQHCDLTVILDSFEGRAHGDFGFAIANVSAKQAIHRHCGFHVLLDICDRGDLIVGLVVVEGIFEFALPLRILRIVVAVRHLALCVELEQFVRHVAHGLLHARLGFCPLRATQAAERGPCAFCRTILLNKIKPCEWNVQLRCLSELQQHELTRGVALGKLLQSLVLRNAVLHVHNIIADDQVAKIRQECGNLRLLPQRL